MKKTDMPFLLSTCLLLLTVFVIPAASAGNENTIINTIMDERFTGDLDEIIKRKKIRALVVYGETDFFFSNNTVPVGMQVDLLAQYEKHLNRNIKKPADRIRMQYIPTAFDRLITDLNNGKGDIIAAMLTITPEREKRIDFISAQRMKVNEVVVASKDSAELKDLDSVEALSGKDVYVLKGSSYAEHLQQLNLSLEKQGLAPLNITESDPHLNSEGILQMVNAGIIPLTVVDDYKARIWAGVLENIEVKEDLAIKSGNHIGWGIRQKNPILKQDLNAFLKQVKKGSHLGNMLFKRYYTNTKWIEQPVTEKNQKTVKHLLALFNRYGEQYGFDGLALAAQGFQESKLDQSLRSHRGAIGIMQLLPSTAADKNVGIPDIETEENNIKAGAKYMAFIRDRYFSDPEISAIDQMALTWAAYNAGPAKVHKMRNMAKKRGLDPNKWFHHVEVAAGELIGRETVEYVSNIFKYYIAYNLIREKNRELNKS